jgi:glycyl-tRNA synthetase beta chain
MATVAIGRFDEEFLEVPREVLETAMESHQRYFPLEGADGIASAGIRRGA